MAKEKTETEDMQYISWAAFHASRQQTRCHPTALNALLPLFYENAHTIAMVRHGMTVIKDATQYLNAGQTPIMAVDQPLYAMAKEIQWFWPEVLGESKFLIMLGGLHIELAALKVLGIG